jgi:hypothetical protein
LKNLFFLLLLFLSANAFAQNSDFLLLKKNRKTIKSLYSGVNIELVTKSGVYKNGTINKIQNDSIFLQEFLISRSMTSMGFYVIDTMGSLHYSYHYKDIQSIIKKAKANFDWSASGAALLGGGIVLSTASGIVYLADRDKFSPQLLIAGAGLGVIGYFLSKIKPKNMLIGKRNYRLEYIKIQ